MLIINSFTALEIVLAAVLLAAVGLVFLTVRAARRYRRIAQKLHDATRRLEHQVARSTTIVEALPVGVEVYSPEGELLSVNTCDCEIFGLTREQALGAKITIAGNPVLPREVKDACARGESIHIDFPYDLAAVNALRGVKTADKPGIRRISCIGRPVRNSSGKIINYVFIADDITDQYDREQQLKASNRLTEQAIKAADLVLWRYDNRGGMLSSYNDPINNYDSSVKIPIDGQLVYAHPDDKPRISRIIALMNEGRDESFEINLRIKTPADKEWQYCVISGAPFSRDDDGRVLEYTGFRRNDTRWQKLNDELLATNRQNELILNNVNSALAFIAPDYTVRWENISTCGSGIFGTAYSKGMRCYNSTYGRETPCPECVMQKAAQSRRVERKVLRLKGRSIEILATPVLEPGGELDGVVIRLDDITEREQMISELQEAKERAEQSDKLKSAFLANMSHEIRTPLNAIVGFAELLMSVDDPDEKAEYSKIIATNNELLLRLINDILNLSKIEAGFLDRKPEKFDMAEHFNELFSSVQQRAVNPGVELICDSPYEHCFVQLDKNRLAQVLLNYATNAIKYTPEGFIRVGYGYQNGGIYLYVADSGIGISEDKKSRVYQRFEKLDEFAQGTGLGLSICKALTEAGGGRVGFESEEGKGSIFWSWIPCRAVFSDDPDEAVEDLPETAAAVPVSRGEGDTRRRILVAEDIESNFKLLSIMFGREYVLSWAKDGAEVLALARDDKYDLILMDMKMPLLNGLEATRRIRVFDEKTPIVALTAYAFESDREAALSAGCNDFLVKPVSRESVAAMLKKWLP